MIRLLLACALALLPLPALAQGNPPAAAAQADGQAWRRADGRLFFAPASISLPDRVGAAAVTQTTEFSSPGENIDNIVQYRSEDGELIGTVYIYYPGLAHVGLTSYATHNAIRLGSTDRLRALGAQVVAAGGHPGTALRLDYANYRDGWASSAGFIKVDRWLVKLRVSAPERRRADVETAMAELLAGIRFEGERPRPATPFEIADCESRRQSGARLLPDNMSEIVGYGVILTMDGAGMTASEGPDIPLLSRVPDRWCLSQRARIGANSVPILRSLGEDPGWPTRSRLVAIVSDAGGLVEVVAMQRTGHFLILHHQIGETALLGSFDAMPSDEQIVAILTGADQAAGRARLRIRLRPGEPEAVEVIAPEAQPAPVT